MSRRGENIYKRKDGRWEGRYPKGRKANGQLQYGYIYGKTYRGVKEQLVVLKSEYQQICQYQGEYAGSLSQWASSWLTEDVQPKVKLSTLASYQHKFQSYILPSIGGIQLNQLTGSNIQNLIHEWQRKKLSGSTIHLLIQLLRKCLAVAKQRGWLLLNPCDNLVLPKRKPMPIKALTRDDQKKIEAVAIKDNQGLPTLLALHTGLRIGEVAALTWNDIDLSNQTISVRHTYQRIPLASQNSKTQLVLSEAKTDSSLRTIPFSTKVKKWLQTWKETHTSKFIFGVNDQPVEPRTLTNHFQKIVKQAGITKIRFHQLRHTFATRCMEAKSHVTAISALLGHASAKMTLDVYTDGLMEQRRQVILAMEEEV